MAGLTAWLPRVAVVGSGPGGFYVVDSLLRKAGTQGVCVDILERLPTPFGLVRYGVAPDHPEVKEVESLFTRLASQPSCNWFGNVTVGKDVSVSELTQLYDAVVLACGAENDRDLPVPGVDLPGVHTAREFVGWYNGHPDCQVREYALSTARRAVVIGQGNVALDVARVLLKSPDELAGTDITAAALHGLRASQIQQVTAVGRRGPLQAAFTTKELREMTKLEGVDCHVDTADMRDALAADLSKDRVRKRQIALLAQTVHAEMPAASATRRLFHLAFFRSPAAFLPGEDGRVAVLRVQHNRVRDDGSVEALDQYSEIPCDIAFRSIGYRSVAMPGVPFDHDAGVIPHDGHGRVLGAADGAAIYVAGWIKRGPSGIIPNNKWCSEETAEALANDLLRPAASCSGLARRGSQGLLELLSQRGVRPVTLDAWHRIDQAEVSAGQGVGKPREKLTSVAAMLDAAWSSA